MKEQFPKKETGDNSGFGTRIWLLLLAGVLGASGACFICTLTMEKFAAYFRTSLIAGGAAGVVLAAAALLVSGKMRFLSGSTASKAAFMLAALGIFFSAASMLMIAEKDTKAPVIAFSSDTVTMRPGDPESVLSSNMVVSDNRDGDLRDQISVVSFVYSEDGATAEVTYAVEDSSGNRAAASQRIRVEGTPWPAE